MSSPYVQDKELLEGVMEKAVVVSQWTSMLNIVKVFFFFLITCTMGGGGSVGFKSVN
jgi:hypothetical protein